MSIIKDTESPDQVFGCCYCGNIHFQIQLPVYSVIFCHCNMCRQANGSDYSAWVSVPRENFIVNEGEMTLIRADTSVYKSHYFCEHCGTTVYTDDIRYPDTYGILCGVIHGEIHREPSRHIFYDRRQLWVEFNDGLPKFGGENGYELLE